MSKICYKDKEFRGDSMGIIVRAEEICQRYANQGYDLTLRQLYYQFVSMDLIPNTEASYKRLGSIVNDARLAGYIDWDHLTDRGRDIDRRSTWDHPREIIQTAANAFHIDWWADQDVHVEVWVEKQALAGVVERVCQQYDVTSLACKGYMSQSEMHTAAMRMLDKIRDGKRIHVIHLGDHDPSGIDMSRDNEDRLRMFIGHHLSKEWGVELDDDGNIWWDILEEERYTRFEIEEGVYADGWRPDEIFVLDRIALNMDQIRQYNPPPNPAKITDSRAVGYIETHGRQSWELDALPPQVLNALIEAHILEQVDRDKFEARQDREDAYKIRITDLLRQHGDILDQINQTEEEDGNDE